MLKGGGGGGRFQTVFLFGKLDFEIAVDQQTNARDRTFEGFRIPDAHRCPQDSHALVWSIFSSILPNHLNMLKTMLWVALLVAISLLNTQINVYQNWIKLAES